MKKCFLLCAVTFCFKFCYAQSKQIDSLLIVYNKTNDLNIKSDVGFNIWKIYASKKDSLNEAKIIDKVQSTFILNNRYDLLAEWYNLIGRNTTGLYADGYSITYILKSIKYLNQGIKFSEKLENSEKKWEIQGNIYRNIGFKYRDVENYSKSIDNQFLALKCYEKVNDLDMVLETYSTLAVIYGRAKDNTNSLKYARKSISYPSKFEYAKKLNVVGNSFLNAEKLDTAMLYFKNALKYDIEAANDKGITINLNQIGIVYNRLNQLDSAYVYLFKSLELEKKINDQLGIGYTYRDLGNLELKKGNYEKAIEYLKTSLEIFKRKKKLGGYSSILKLISESYESIGNTNEALRYYKQAKKLDDSLINTSTIREVAIKEATFNYTKDQELSALKLKDKSVAIELLNKKNELQQLILRKNELENIEKNKSIQLLSQQDSLKSFTIRQSKAILKQNEIEAKIKSQELDALNKENKAKEAIALVESRRQKNIIWSIIMGLLLLTTFLIFMVQRFKISQKQNRIIEKQKTDVDEKNILLQNQRNHIEEKHREIKDSINYAERIQRSFLASKELLDDNLKEYFVFFQPKDVVSGDFYWASKLNNGNFALVIADSTGHGVPGAIMSILNITSLEKAIENLNKPDEILNHTRKTIIERLKKDGSEHGGKDGMDCSLIVFDNKNKQLFISASNNPVLIVKENGEIIEIKPDKMPVGKHDKDNNPFTLKTIDVTEGDVIFALTDGFPDQFGGDVGKKFMIKNLKNLLLTNSHLPMSEQKQLLKSIFEKWVGNLEQVDDVTIFGIRL
jgi:serine phosphatase RsbU (regulator of sigma subunit)/tetratricopeptide (TPR) repeat protein